MQSPHPIININHVHFILTINNMIITTQQFHIISHNSSNGENTPYYDIITFNTQQIIYTSSYNHIKLYTKGL